MGSLLKRSVAEFIGTALLVFFGAGAAVITLMIVNVFIEGQGLQTTAGIGHLGGIASWLGIGLAFGFTIMAVIYAFGRVSGAHINPAVTIALWAIKKFPAKDTGYYVVAQLLGAVFASLLFGAMVGPDAWLIGGLGATAPGFSAGVWGALIAEIVGTFILMAVIMGVAVDKQASPGFAGLAIGLTVAGVITTLGAVSGASLNPARSFGPMVGDLLLGGPNVLGVFWIYVVGPIVGALLAVFLYQWFVTESEDSS